MALALCLILLASFLSLVCGIGGPFWIVNMLTEHTLDANTNGASQYDNNHPRPFMWEYSIDYPALNHVWEVYPTGDSGYFMIRSALSGLCLDGNSNNPPYNYRPANVVPFLWECHPEASNHLWELVHIAADIFTIRGVYSGKYLDGNEEDYVPNYSKSHKNPFLWEKPPGTAPINMQWRFIQARTYLLPSTVTSILKPVWWLEATDAISHCHLIETSASCTAYGQYGIQISADEAGTSGLLQINTTSGKRFAFGYEFIRTLTKPCLMGKLTGGKCVCDRGWNGPDCGSVWMLTVPETPRSYSFLPSHDTITSAEIFTGFAKIPWSAYIWERNVTLPSTSYLKTIAHNVDQLSLVLNGGSITWPFQHSSCSVVCIHGISQPDGSCKCQSGWKGIDCNIAF